MTCNQPLPATTIGGKKTHKNLAIATHSKINQIQTYEPTIAHNHGWTIETHNRNHHNPKQNQESERREERLVLGHKWFTC